MSDSLSPNRLEAFSDGVIAVIITIMVLELKVPPKDVGNIAGLHAILPLLLVYLLSFVETGIYWVNHHYLIDDLDHVTHGILWSNLAFLFCLSLIPFATTWVGIRGISSFSIALYTVCCALPAVSWIVLSTVICRSTGKPLAGSPLQQIISATLYLSAIFLSYVSPYIALGLIVVVAIRWLIPPRRIVEQVRALAAEKPTHTNPR
jgi:uncharacterized membrane protein